MKKYQILDHTADIRINLSADTLNALFEVALEALLSIVKNETFKFSKQEYEEEFLINAESKEELLVKFLNEILFFIYYKQLFPKKILTLKIEKEQMFFKAHFYKLTEFKHSLEIKAITYGDLEIEKKQDIYTATVIVDV